MQTREQGRTRRKTGGSAETLGVAEEMFEKMKLNSSCEAE